MSVSSIPVQAGSLASEGSAGSSEKPAGTRLGTRRRNLPNDRRTRQLYIDAAIKRAQAKARAARRQAAVDAETDEGVGAAAGSGAGIAAAAGPVRPRSPLRTS